MNKLKIPEVIKSAEKEQNNSEKIFKQGIAESKPLSLRIFEKELEKAERGLLGASLREKLATNADLEKNFDPKTVFSNEERAEIKSKAIEVVKEKLEPKELNADNREISPEASRQAFATYKQMGKATNLWLTSDDKSKVTEAFSKLDREAVKLNQIRQDYNRNEKLALLRDGIKTDLMDWLKKNPDSKQTNYEEQINKILTSNLSKADFVKLGDNGKQVSILSRQIVEKIESKQILAVNQKTFASDTREINSQTKNPLTTKNNQPQNSLLKNEKAREIPVFVR